MGLGCRFPQARDPLAYWELIRTGTVAFRPIPRSRWDHDAFFDPTTRIPDKTYIDKGAYLEDEDLRQFASLHFGIAPRRIQVTDPQHRLLLDAVRAALQDAGYEAQPLQRSRTGVFIGASANEHKEIITSRLRAVQLFDGAFGRALRGAEEARDALVEQVVPMRAFSMAGNLLNMHAAIVAQVWDLSGPAMAIDAACSSALVAAQQAIVNLRAGEIDLAIAGGAYVNLMPDNLVGFSRIGAISRRGECRPFDARADGFLMGEGIGVVLLKRLADAQRDGDRIYAIVKGAAANNDGKSDGPMTPRQGGQLEALQAAYRDAGFSPVTLGYLEAHGTATTVGDVVEVSALRDLFVEAGWSKAQGARTALGSVKANIGHTMSAAGVAGLIKAALALHYKTLPPQPSVEEENPNLELGKGPFFLPRKEMPWESNGHPRRAGVSSFGFGGTNAHLVLEEAPAKPRRARPALRKARAELFLLSGARASVVARTARELADALPALQRSADFADIAWTLSRRAPGDARLAVVADSFAQLGERLAAAAEALERTPAEDPLTPVAPRPPAQLLPGVVFAQGPFADRKLALLFPGQGLQRVGLLREAYEQIPAFREALDRLDDALGPELHAQLGGTLRSFLYAQPSLEAEKRLTATEVCQPAMAAIGLALHSLLERMGVKGDVALGHSLGEFAACAAAGMLSAEDCVRLVARRGLSMSALPLADRGAMASAAADAASVTAAIAGIDGVVVVANLNHPKQTVISGTTAAVRAAGEKLSAQGVQVTPLEVSHAFHSPLMEGLPVADLLAQPTRPAAFPVISAVTGAPYPEDPREIWQRHAAAPVDFVSALRGAGARIWLQVGAGSVLSSFVKATLPEEERLAVASLASREEDGLFQLAFALGQIWTAGVALDLSALFEGRDACLVTLPPSALETQPYWAIEPPKAARPPLRLPLSQPDGRGTRVPQPEGGGTPIEGQMMDPLVALFREQVALLQQQAKVLEQQAKALGQRGIAVPELPKVLPAPASPPPLAAVPAREPVPITARPGAAATDRAAHVITASVARISAFPAEAIKPAQTLVGDLGFDSLMTVELDSDVSKAFPDIGALPRSLLGPTTTVQDLIDHVARALAEPRSLPTISAALGAFASEGPELLFFAPALVEAPLLPAAPAESPLPRSILITRDAEGIADALAPLLSALGHEVKFEGAADCAIHLEGSLEEACNLARAHSGMFVAATVSADAALSGFVKSLARERSGELVKYISLRREDGAAAMAQAIFAELRSGNAAPEAHWANGVRYEPDLRPAAVGAPIDIGAGDVVLVTGGTRGVGLKLARALAEKGAAVVLAGRNPPDAEAPGLFVRWDVTRPAGSALDAARARLGKFTALVHAAGIAEDRAAGEIDAASLRRVLAPKLDGLANALAALAGDPLRAVIAISSWAGRFGNAGQASYAAANAALSAEVARLKAQRPGLRALSLEYPPWQDTAMVAKIPPLVRAALVEQGVPFIDDAAGTAALLAALQAGVEGPILLAHARPARAVAHRLQMQVARRDHFYLEDHQLAGMPVLPLAAALDLAAFAAEEASGLRGGPLLVRDFRLRQPVRIADTSQFTLSVAGAHAGELGITLSAIPGRGPAYTAFASPGADVAPALSSARPAPRAAKVPELPMTLEEFYSSYTFHGPRMRAIESIEQIGPQGIVGTLRTSKPSDWIRSPRRSEWSIDPLALDGAFQLAAYWAWNTLHRAGLPVGIEEFVQLAPLGEGPVRASLTLEESAGDEVRGTIVLQGRDGRVLAVARGVQGEFKHRDPRFLIGRASARPAEQAKAPKVDEANYRIELFPEVQELEQRLGLATAFGLKIPYFNVHERVTNDTSVIGGRTMINWSSYNYLGFSGDPHVTRAAQAAVERYGTSVSASRVASGEKPLHRELEQELARFLGTEDSVVMVSGHGVFVTVIGHMVGDGDLVLHDSLAHDCILGGAKLSGAKRRPFPHSDWAALEKQLQQLRPHYRRVLIAVEGVYSMDGDISPLPHYVELKKKYGALLLVDEAHSIGVLGKTGRGVGEHFQINRNDVDFWMGTLSKSFASCGGYVAGSKSLVQYLKYTAPGFIYSVGISPANAAAALEALHQLEAHPEKVARLHERAELFLQLAKEKGIDTGFAGGSAVVPAILGNSLHSMQVSEALRQRGINVQPILYPAVEETAARLRFFCTATHSEQQIRETVEVLAEEIAKVRAESEQPTGSI
ncbi:MAG: aminotransferase class I/II-fold pyridoxal phosphate-dependent enzyme [Deltaproteobacteria bacterium]|nr:MAG: aminotransferase class I/II-fold pyridoxal phosphate-dependent enzyme [Deltaproteobacteria bacterium]